VKFSRHAKNRIRLLGFRLADVEAVVSGEPGALDEKGNLIYSGEVSGIPVHVVVAADDPSFIITVHPKETR